MYIRVYCVMCMCVHGVGCITVCVHVFLHLCVCVTVCIQDVTSHNCMRAKVMLYDVTSRHAMAWTRHGDTPGPTSGAR